MLKIAKAIIKHLDGCPEASETLRYASIQTAWEAEDDIQEAFDCYFYEEVTRLRMNLDGIRSIADH